MSFGASARHEKVFFFFSGSVIAESLSAALILVSSCVDPPCTDHGPSRLCAASTSTCSTRSPTFQRPGQNKRAVDFFFFFFFFHPVRVVLIYRHGVPRWYIHRDPATQLVVSSHAFLRAQSPSPFGQDSEPDVDLSHNRNAPGKLHPATPCSLRCPRE